MATDTRLWPVEAQEILRQIRNAMDVPESRRRPVYFHPGGAKQDDVAPVPTGDSAEDESLASHPDARIRRAASELTARLKIAHAALRTRTSDLDALPPAPPTFRGRIGSVLVGLIRRGLWWYALQLERFAESVQNQSREAIALFERLACGQVEFKEDVGALRRELDEIRAGQQTQARAVEEVAEFCRRLAMAHTQADEESRALRRQLGQVQRELSAIRPGQSGAGPRPGACGDP